MTNKEAIYIINNRLNTYYCTDEDLQALDLAVKALEEERPQGEWAFKDLHNGKIWYECSICGRKIHIGDKVQLSDFPFCHCGADMRGEKNE